MAETNFETFLNRLAFDAFAARTEVGLSMRALGAMAGSDWRLARQIENGKPVTLESLFAVLRALELTPGQLLDAAFTTPPGLHPADEEMEQTDGQ